MEFSFENCSEAHAPPETHYCFQTSNEYFKLSINYWRFYFHAANNYKQNKLKHNLFFNLPSLIIGFIIFVVDSLILRIKYENRDN